MSKRVFTKMLGSVLVTLASLGSGFAQSSSPACNKNLIEGTYGFTVHGTKLAGIGPTGPQVGVAMTQFDGKGTFTQIDTVTINGEVVSDFTHTPATGTYTVNSNCTGWVQLEGLFQPKMARKLRQINESLIGYEPEGREFESLRAHHTLLQHSGNSSTLKNCAKQS